MVNKEGRKMKRISVYTLLAAALFTAGACSQSEKAVPETPAMKKLITATLEPVSRVSYEEEALTAKLIQTWEVDDELIGLDDADHVITMRVAEVDAGGVATLELTGASELPASGSIHMMYAPGCYAGPTWPTSLDLGSQAVAEGTSVPAVLTADAAVSGQSVNLSFSNRTAILGIKGFHGLPASATVDHFEVGGVLTTANLSVSAGTIALSSFGGSSVTLAKAGAWTADASGEIDDVFYVAALPNASASPISIQAVLTDGSIYRNDLGSKTVAAAKYYYMNNKEMDLVVAFVGSTPCYSFEEALTVANACGTGCTITLVADCSMPTSDLLLTNNSGAVTLDVNGHTLDMAGQSLEVSTSGVELTMTDSDGAGGIVQGGSSSLLYVTDGRVVIRDISLSCSDGRALRMGGGEVNIHEGVSIRQTKASTYLMYVTDGTLSIDGGEFEHTNASGYMMIYTATGTPEINITGGVFRCPHTGYSPFIFNTASAINIGGDALFINTGTKTTFSFSIPANSNNVHVTGGYYVVKSSSYNVFTSSNSNVVTLSGGYFRYPSLTASRCTYKTSHSVSGIYPSVSKEGYTFGYRISHTNISRWSFAITDGEAAYPAQRNAKYTPSSSAWAFQTSEENYSSGYLADEVNLFTWGLPSEYTDPASASGRTGLFAGVSLEADDDWGAFMPSDNLFTPTKDQWDYLLNTRSASTVNGVANARYMKCTFQDSPGLLIFPDSFTWPASAGSESAATAVNDPAADFSITYYRSLAGYLTGAGCIFLRADGYRDGSSDADCGSKGYYWTSTTAGSNEPWYLYFDSSSLELKHSAGMDVTKGAAVRVFSR